ncbi:MAG: hypothetical protein AAF721_04385 [Myxococcota bacterium]
MSASPLFVLLGPRAATPALHDLGLGLRAHLAAGLHAGGVDVFAPGDPEIDGREDPRRAVPGSRGVALCRAPLRPQPDGYVTLELSLGRDQHVGSLQLLSGDSLVPQVELEFEGSAEDIVEFFEEALAALLAHVDVELPLRWPDLLGVDDPDQAVAVVFAEGEAERLRGEGRRPAAFPN